MRGLLHPACWWSWFAYHIHLNKIMEAGALKQGRRSNSFFTPFPCRLFAHFLGGVHHSLLCSGPHFPWTSQRSSSPPSRHEWSRTLPRRCKKPNCQANSIFPSRKFPLLIPATTCLGEFDDLGAHFSLRGSLEAWKLRLFAVRRGRQPLRPPTLDVITTTTICLV